MTLAPETLPKDAKTLPPEAQKVFLAAYNQDFGWRCSEQHAEKAAWRAVLAQFPDAAPKA
jgi:cation transport regulator ChaB